MAIFNEQMNSIEAREALWNACKGKTKEERASIMKAYEDVSSKILMRELNENKNFMTSII